MAPGGNVDEAPYEGDQPVLRQNAIGGRFDHWRHFFASMNAATSVRTHAMELGHRQFDSEAGYERLIGYRHTAYSVNAI